MVPQNEIPGEHLVCRYPLLNVVVAISTCTHNMDLVSENIDIIVSFIAGVDALVYILTNWYSNKFGYPGGSVFSLPKFYITAAYMLAQS